MHEHVCPLCGDSWACYEPHKQRQEEMLCEDCKPE